jgi:hypothetical protein
MEAHEQCILSLTQYLLTNSLEQSSSLGADKDIPCLLLHPSLEITLIQVHPAYTLHPISLESIILLCSQLNLSLTSGAPV